MLRAIVLAASVGLGSAALGAAAQPAGYVPREQRNGALKYWEAWGVISPDLSKRASDVDWDAIKGVTEWDALPAEFRALADEPLDSIANSLENAANHGRCNFELQWEDGVMTLMPHLSKMRGAARVMRVAARVDLAKGRPEKAAKGMAVVLKSAQDTSRDPVLISSLVGIAVADLALSEIEVQADSGKLTPAAKSTLLTALRGIDTVDPMNTRASVVGEKEAFVPWVEKQFEGEKPGQNLMDLVDLENGVRKDEAKAYFGSLTKETFRKDIARIRQAYDALLVAWDKPGGKAELDAFSKKVEAGEYGTLAKYFLPSIGNAKAAQEKFRARLAGVIEKVEKAPVVK